MLECYRVFRECYDKCYSLNVKGKLFDTRY